MHEKSSTPKNQEQLSHIPLPFNDRNLLKLFIYFNL